MKQDKKVRKGKAFSFNPIDYKLEYSIDVYSIDSKTYLEVRKGNNLPVPLTKDDIIYLIKGLERDQVKTVRKPGIISGSALYVAPYGRNKYIWYVAAHKRVIKVDTERGEDTEKRNRISLPTIIFELNRGSLSVYFTDVNKPSLSSNIWKTSFLNTKDEVCMGLNSANDLDYYDTMDDYLMAWSSMFLDSPFTEYHANNLKKGSLKKYWKALLEDPDAKIELKDIKKTNKQIRDLL